MIFLFFSGCEVSKIDNSHPMNIRVTSTENSYFEGLWVGIVDDTLPVIDSLIINNDGTFEQIEGKEYYYGIWKIYQGSYLYLLDSNNNYSRVLGMNSNNIQQMNYEYYVENGIPFEHMPNYKPSDWYFKITFYKYPSNYIQEMREAEERIEEVNRVDKEKSESGWIFLDYTLGHGEDIYYSSVEKVNDNEIIIHLKYVAHYPVSNTSYGNINYVDFKVNCAQETFQVIYEEDYIWQYYHRGLYGAQVGKWVWSSSSSGKYLKNVNYWITPNSRESGIFNLGCR